MDSQLEDAVEAERAALERVRACIEAERRVLQKVKACVDAERCVLLSMRMYIDAEKRVLEEKNDALRRALAQSSGSGSS
jgi:hypothetical protein